MDEEKQERDYPKIIEAFLSSVESIVAKTNRAHKAMLKQDGESGKPSVETIMTYGILLGFQDSVAMFRMAMEHNGDMDSIRAELNEQAKKAREAEEKAAAEKPDSERESESDTSVS